MIFVTLGNAKQNFDRLVKAVVQLQAYLPEENIVVQYGHTSISGYDIKGQKFYDKDTFESHIKNCDILITHSGAGTLITAIQLGKSPLVWPRRKMYNEHINDHQLEICDQFQKLGYCDIVESIEEIQKNISLSSNKKNLVETKDSSLKLEIKNLLKNLGLKKI